MMSSIYVTAAVMYGEYENIFPTFILFIPWRMAVMVPSGISSTFIILATVPYSKRSCLRGSSTDMSFWGTAPMKESRFSASRMRAMDFSRPIVTGYTMLGKRTAFLNARTGRLSGRSPGLTLISDSPCITGIMLTSAPAGNIMSLILSVFIDIS